MMGEKMKEEKGLRAAGVEPVANKGPFDERCMPSASADGDAFLRCRSRSSAQCWGCRTRRVEARWNRSHQALRGPAEWRARSLWRSWSAASGRSRPEDVAQAPAQRHAAPDPIERPRGTLPGPQALATSFLKLGWRDESTADGAIRILTAAGSMLGMSDLPDGTGTPRR